MRIAVTTGLLRIPPTYFVTQHAERLVASGAHDARVVARATDIRDARLGVEVVSAVAESAGSWRTRALRALVAGGRQRDAIVEYAPEVVHQHFATWASGALDAARRRDAPSVVTLHGYDVFAAESRSPAPLAAFHRASIGRVTREATRLLAVSDYLRERAERAGFPAERLERHYQGVDTDFFTPDSVAATDPAGELPTALFVGAWERRKGVLDAIESSIALTRSGCPHRLVIAGAGSLRDRVEAAAREHDHIEAVGAVARDGVRSLMRGADVFVMPTQRDGAWREAAGLVLLEAQACGTPVVTYRSGGAPEMLQEGETGLVVAEGDRAALADAVGSLLRLRGAERAAWGSRARDWVVAERSLASSVAELERHYAALG